MKILMLAALAALSLTGAAQAKTALPPAAIYTDSTPDKAHPARSEVLHIPTAGVMINGLAYIPSGAGPHPTVVLLHGLPGNEKNLDLAQAMRRAGWTVVTFNYRGSWGSPGTFSFHGNLADAKAVLAYVRTADVAAKLQIAPGKLVLMGHSMGGWVTGVTGGQDDGLAGVALISAADMSQLRRAPLATRMQTAAENMEALTGVTAESMAAEMATLRTDESFAAAAPGLVKTPLLVLTSDDGLAPVGNGLAAAVKAAGGTRVTAIHIATDHSYNTARIGLETDIVLWLAKLK